MVWELSTLDISSINIGVYTMYSIFCGIGFLMSNIENMICKICGTIYIYCIPLNISRKKKCDK